MDLSALFVNYNSWSYLADAIASLRAHPARAPDGRTLRFEVVVVDNASSVPDPGGLAEVERHVAETGGEIILHEENGGYAKGMNLALRRSTGRHVLACNPDILFTPDAVTNLVAFLEAHPSAGVAAPAVFADPGLEVQLPVHILPTIADLLRTTLGSVSVRWNRRYVEARTRAALPVWGTEEPLEEKMFGGCCFLTRRDLIDRIGFFDERYPLYHEDTDLGIRVRRAGKRIFRVGAARVVHLYDRSASTDREEAEWRLRVSRARYFAKWYGPAGSLLDAACTRFLGTGWARRRARGVCSRDVQRVEWVENRPVFRLRRPCARFLIEIAYEPFLFLAAATFGRGDRWVPSDGILSGLRESWIRAVDVSDGNPLELGVWRYRPRASVADDQHSAAPT